MQEIERRNLILGALALHDKMKIKEIAQIVEIDEAQVREIIYEMGTEPWFKDFGKITGSFGKEEWKRQSILKPSLKMRSIRPELSETYLTLLGIVTQNKDIHVSYLADLAGLPSVDDLRKILCKLAA